VSFYILSHNSGDVTYKDGVLDWTHHLQYLITIHSGTITNSHSLQFTTHALSPLSLLSLTNPPELASNGSRFPSWVPELSPSHSDSSELPPHVSCSVLYGALPITDSCCPLSLACMTLGRTNRKHHLCVFGWLPVA
jgi:hypothetical protein